MSRGKHTEAQMIRALASEPRAQGRGCYAGGWSLSSVTLRQSRAQQLPMKQMKDACG